MSRMRSPLPVQVLEVLLAALLGFAIGNLTNSTGTLPWGLEFLVAGQANRLSRWSAPRGLHGLHGPRPVPGNAGFDAHATIGDQAGQEAEVLASFDQLPQLARSGEGYSLAVASRRHVAAGGYAKSPASRERRWALALTTCAYCKTNLDLMNVITHAEASPR
ncbi:MAG TPA: hypothetical protein VGO16_10120 [Pseudonocardiaceae bacterium]|nr:hypothetical protein [Pseudonocardiaceae bacterium]